MKLITIRDLTYWYGEKMPENPVLRNINLDIKSGEFITIVGANGCGKSTLLRHLNGLLLPCQGSVRVNDMPVEGQNLQVIRQTVGMVFQNPDTQLFASIVEEDVAFGMENLCVPSDQIKDRVKAALSQVGMLQYSKHPPHRLSGGQKQKVALAGVLAMRPACIALDEPTSMLDPKGKKEVMEAVLNLNDRYGIAVVYVTHDMTETFFSSRLIALADGEIIFDGMPQDFFRNSTVMKKTGLQIPPFEELAMGLESEGISLPSGIKSAKDLVDYLCR